MALWYRYTTTVEQSDGAVVLLTVLRLLLLTVARSIVRIVRGRTTEVVFVQQAALAVLFGRIAD